MKHLAATVLALGAVAAFATPASAVAQTNLGLSANMQPATITVNGKKVSVDDGYEATFVRVNEGTVRLSAATKVNIGSGICGTFSSWSDGNRSASRSITVRGATAYAPVAYYGRSGC